MQLVAEVNLVKYVLCRSWTIRIGAAPSAPRCFGWWGQKCLSGLWPRRTFSWRTRPIRSSPSPVFRKANGAAFVRRTNAIERLHEEFKRRIKTWTVLPSANTAAMLFWALLTSGQINMRKVDGWQSLATKPID